MLSVKSLLGLECFQRITLEAGKSGLHRRISWPNIAQTASIREWLVGGDVILMSGVGLDHSAAFLNDMIEQAVAGDAACLIILLHREVPALQMISLHLGLVVDSADLLEHWKQAL